MLILLSPELNVLRVIQLISKEMRYRLYILALKTNAPNYTVPSHAIFITTLYSSMTGQAKNHIWPAACFLHEVLWESSYAHLFMS